MTLKPFNKHLQNGKKILGLYILEMNCKFIKYRIEVVIWYHQLFMANLTIFGLDLGLFVGGFIVYNAIFDDLILI